MTQTPLTASTSNSEDPSKSPTAWSEIIFGVAKNMDAAETLTTAIYMIYLCDPSAQQVSITPKVELSAAVHEALTIAERKTSCTKLEIAIELLHSLIIPSDDEEEIDADPYGYITPALDEDEEDDSGLSGEFEEDDDSYGEEG